MPDMSRLLSVSLVRALINRRTHVLELFLGLESLIWGAWILDPLHDTFGALPTAYTVLGLVPEWAIGLVWTMHGSVSLYALWRTISRPGLRSRTHWIGLCRRAALAGVGLWSLVLVSFLAAVPGSTATPIYLGLVLANAWVYLRLHLKYT